MSLWRGRYRVSEHVVEGGGRFGDCTGRRVAGGVGASAAAVDVGRVAAYRGGADRGRGNGVPAAGAQCRPMGDRHFAGPVFHAAGDRPYRRQCRSHRRGHAVRIGAGIHRHRAVAALYRRRFQDRVVCFGYRRRQRNGQPGRTPRCPYRPRGDRAQCARAAGGGDRAVHLPVVGRGGPGSDGAGSAYGARWRAGSAGCADLRGGGCAS